MDVFPRMAPDDEVLEAVLRATLTLISERGYDAATVGDIAAMAGVTEGFVFGRYATKRDLLADSLHRQQTAGWQLNTDYLARLSSDFEPGIAAAILMREVMTPGRDLGRDMTLELLRMSWHDEAMLADAVRIMDASDPLGDDPGFTVDVAADFGTYLLPRLAPDAWKLPMDVVFVPLHQARAQQG
jgi:AcrR family transcriptional regulator